MNCSPPICGRNTTSQYMIADADVTRSQVPGPECNTPLSERSLLMSR